MNYQTWVDLTKKRGYPRSSNLKVLDNALWDYENSNGTIQALRAAFDKWIATKPSQVDNIRNRNLDAQGLGPVQRLWRYIRNEEGNAAANKQGVTHDASSNVFLTDDTDYTNVNRKVVYETIKNVKEAIRAARESFQSGGFLSKVNFDAVYTMWFGARDAQREQGVKCNYDTLEQVICNQAVHVHDDYKATGEFGHAYRGRHTQANIWLGEGFWDMDPAMKKRFTSAMDAKVGTVLHEFCHATVDAADERLGDKKVCNDAARDRLLAQQFPDGAVNNADNLANYALDCLFIKTGRGRVP